nr:YdeI/OmpD-associated family protein [cf. Phormidesmis sp. LEGE 11477]
MKKVERAKANGSWTFLDDVEALLIPEDLSVELEANPVAKQNFEKFSPSSKKGILQWIKMAKRSQTRRQRIEKTVAQAALNQKAI